MRREEKEIIINDLYNRVSNSKHFYLADISGLNAEDTSKLRRICFKKEIGLLVVKNTLLRKALEKLEQDFTPLNDILKDSTSILFCETGNIPAKMIRDFRKKHDKPVLKGAYVEESFYIGDNMLEALANIKSKDELLSDLLSLLQSPMNNLLSALSSPGNKMAGALKTLSERE